MNTNKLLESFQSNLNESIKLPNEAIDLGNGLVGENYNTAENTCKFNAVQAYLNKGEEIYVGSVKVDGNEITHFFNVKAGNVVDHSGTAQIHDMTEYKGVSISKVLESKGFKFVPNKLLACIFKNDNGDIIECGNFGNKLYFKLNNDYISYGDLLNI